MNEDSWPPELLTCIQCVTKSDIATNCNQKKKKKSRDWKNNKACLTNIHLTILTGKNLCFTEFSTKIH